MVETYSNNIVVAANSSVPFNNISILKGCTASKNSPGTIELNKCGVYKITFSVSAVANEVGSIVFEMLQNGIIKPQTVVSETSANTTSIHSMSFTTFVQVPGNNSKCDSCTSPVTIDILNAGVGVTLNTVDLVIDKVC